MHLPSHQLCEKNKTCQCEHHIDDGAANRITSFLESTGKTLLIQPAATKYDMNC